MKILISDKLTGNISIVHDLGKALNLKVENLAGDSKLLTIDYESRGYAYSDDDCNFFVAEVVSNFSVDKTLVSIPEIIARFMVDS